MSEVQYAIAILKEKLGNADKHNLQYQRLSIADMEAIWGVLSKCESDYAELKAQRDALAVECSHYKSVAEKMADRADDYKSGHLGYPCFDSSNEIKQGLLTPATDAYLNSVRAEGVEALTKILQVMIDAGDFAGDEVGAIAGAIDAGNFHAAQLRAGKDGE